MNGFRKMISDNIPKTWDLALRWCECRTKWIEYVYNTHVKKYNTDWRGHKKILELKSTAVKQMTQKQKFDGMLLKFDDTINFDILFREDPEQYEAWKTVSTWVSWFSENYAYIKSTADIQLTCKYKSVDETVEYICKKYNLDDVQLVYFILNDMGYDNQ